MPISWSKPISGLDLSDWLWSTYSCRPIRYDNIVGILQAHFALKPLVIAERFWFHKRNWGKRKQYVAVLKRLSEHCEFGEYLEDALWNRFVCGLKCETVQKHLLTEKDVMFLKAFDYAVLAEVQQLSGSLKGFFTVCCRKKVINATTAWKWIILMMTSGTKTMYKTRARSSQDWNWKEKEGNSEQKGNAMNTEWRTKREKFIMLQQVNVNKCKDNVKESDLTLIVIWICILCLEKRYIHKSQWCL